MKQGRGILFQGPQTAHDPLAIAPVVEEEPFFSPHQLPSAFMDVVMAPAAQYQEIGLGMHFRSGGPAHALGDNVALVEASRGAAELTGVVHLYTQVK